MKIKFLATCGKNVKDSVAEIDDLKAKSYIDDGLAIDAPSTDEEVAMNTLLEAFTVKADAVVAKATSNHLGNITKAVTNSIKVGNPNSFEDGFGGFKNISHFLLEIKRSGEGLANPTPLIVKHVNTEEMRMKTAGATPSGLEGTLSLTAGASGGAPVPIGMLGEIYRMTGAQPDFFGMGLPVNMNSLSVRFPILKNYNRSNSTTSAGIVPQTAGEGNVQPNSVANWEQQLLTAVTIVANLPVSNEMLQDNNVSYIDAVVAQGLWQINRYKNGGVIKGSSIQTGFTGLIGHAATKIVGRAVNGTIGFTDIVNMYAAFDTEGCDFGNSIFIAHPTVYAAIYNSSVGSWPALIAAGGGANNLPLTLLGRPVYSSGYAAALGTTADLILWSPKDYLSGYRGSVSTFVSPHVFAISYQTLIQLSERCVGQPARSGLTTLEDGSTTVAACVVLGQVGGLS